MQKIQDTLAELFAWSSQNFEIFRLSNTIITCSVTDGRSSSLLILFSTVVPTHDVLTFSLSCSRVISLLTHSKCYVTQICSRVKFSFIFDSSSYESSKSVTCVTIEVNRHLIHCCIYSCLFSLCLLWPSLIFSLRSY